MARFRAYLFDLDGTLYRGNEAIPEAVEALDRLRSEGALVRFVTNNASLTREALVRKLTGMGFAAALDEVYSSSYVTAQVLARDGFQRVYVVGEPGMVFTLREFGLQVVNADDEGRVFPTQDKAEAVAAGICRTHLSYPLIDAAMQQIVGGAEYVATNRDATFPLEGGRFSPGAGAVVAMLETCSGVTPRVFGKPNADFALAILQDMGLSPLDAVLVGDRLDTDIACGLAAGTAVHLVKTGVDQCAPEGITWSETLAGLE